MACVFAVSGRGGFAGSSSLGFAVILLPTYCGHTVAITVAMMKVMPLPSF